MIRHACDDLPDQIHSLILRSHYAGLIERLRVERIGRQMLADASGEPVVSDHEIIWPREIGGG